MKIAIVAGLLLLAVSFPLAMQRSMGNIEGGSIEGVISNDSGPLAGAAVEAQHLMSGEVTRATANDSGYYRLAGLRRGWYSLLVIAPNRNSISFPKIFVEEGSSSRKDVRFDSLPSSESVVPSETLRRPGLAQ